MLTRVGYAHGYTTGLRQWKNQRMVCFSGLLQRGGFRKEQVRRGRYFISATYHPFSSPAQFF